MLRTILLYYLLLALAMLGCTKVARADRWQPLGSYSLLNPAGLPTSRFLQLAITDSGQLRGTYFDGIRSTSLTLRGRVDLDSGQAEWRIDGMPQLRFRASLVDLTQPGGALQIVQLDGTQEFWRITREDGWR
jgi:hypothetical protein